MSRHQEFIRSLSPEEENERINKLPLWVRQKIEQLERNVDDAKKEIQRLRNERSRILDTPDYSGDIPRMTWEYLLENGEHPLPRGVNVRIYPERKRHDWITVRFREDDEVLEVSGSGTIQLEPRAANNVYVRLIKR